MDHTGSRVNGCIGRVPRDPKQLGTNEIEMIFGGAGVTWLGWLRSRVWEPGVELVAK
jgi:hypothetical protein